jgi:hypothetical protein
MARFAAMLAVMLFAGTPARPAAAGVLDDAWLTLHADGRLIGWAREVMAEEPGGAIRVERWAAAGDRREHLVASLDAAGRPTGLLAIGPLRVPAEWEATAVAELREQASALADEAARLDARPTRARVEPGRTAGYRAIPVPRNSNEAGSIAPSR